MHPTARQHPLPDAGTDAAEVSWLAPFFETLACELGHRVIFEFGPF
jgi:hypothetical protein